MTTAIKKLVEELLSTNLPIIIEESNQIHGEIFAFMGMGTEGNGTSTTVFKLAKRVAEAAAEKKILIMDFNITEPELEDLIFDIKKKSNLNLDQIYNQANSGKISGRDITSHSNLVKGTNNLYFVSGTRLNYLADHFDAEVLRAVLQAARQEYEYIFVDTPAHFDNAAVVASVIEADVLTCITDYGGAGLRLFNAIKSSVFDTHPEITAKIKLLGIEKRKQDVTPEIISEVLGIKLVASISNIDDSDLYYSSLDKFLKFLELEYPSNDVVTKKSLLSRFKLNYKPKKNKSKRR